MEVLEVIVIVLIALDRSSSGQEWEYL
jgi:hypothetical protein